jgi:hypothetical protein
MYGRDLHACFVFIHGEWHLWVPRVLFGHLISSLAVFVLQSFAHHASVSHLMAVSLFQNLGTSTVVLMCKTGNPGCEHTKGAHDLQAASTSHLCGPIVVLFAVQPKRKEIGLLISLSTLTCVQLARCVQV